MSVILGINTFHAGSSATLLIDGEPVSAISEERLNRVKYFGGFPALAIEESLRIAGIEYKDIDYVALGTDRSANRAAKVKYTLKNLSRLPKLVGLNKNRRSLNNVGRLIAEECGTDEANLKFRQVNVEHHIAHIASAFFSSPYEEATGFSLDGSGDFVTCMIANCVGDEIDVRKRIFIPNSLGSLYTMACELIGYSKYGDEGKVMGLAPYGKDKYKEIFDQMLKLKEGEFKLNLKYFSTLGSNQGITMNDKGEMIQSRHYSDYTTDILGVPNESIEYGDREKDIAFGIQRVFSEAYLYMLKSAHKIAPHSTLVMAGGCALNSVANGMIYDKTPFKDTWIQPAAGDEGLSMGAALFLSRSILREKKRYVMENSYLGPEFSDSEIQEWLNKLSINYQKMERKDLLKITAEEISKGSVVGWFQGRMEWGPRALGNRSILAHPGLPDMKQTLNDRIKHREWFRPFAPAVLVERQADIFDHEQPSPHMLHVYGIKPEWQSRLCAVNHVDNTGRLQSVSNKSNPLFHDLIKTFDNITGIPVILNTSFNENEPIVCNPREAIECFSRTKMDLLTIGSFICRK